MIEEKVDLNYTPEFEAAEKCIKQLEDKYKEKLQINKHLDRKTVSFQANKSEPIYRWFHYREGFSKQLVEYILDTLEVSEGGKLLDPFAGTGAAAFVANSYKNMQGIGIELMPVGVFFIKCRNVFATLTTEKIIEYAQRTLACREEWQKVEVTWQFQHLNITKGAFEEESEKELCRYKTWVANQEDTGYRIFLDFVAFSVLESFSYTRKDGQYLRWDHRSPRFNDSKRKTTFNKGHVCTFHEAITGKLNNIINDLNVSYDLFEQPPKIGSNTIEIKEGTVLSRVYEIADSDIDIVITSPPYCNRYDYTRTYALELAYLGIDEIQIRKLRQTLLTCTVENKPKDFSWVSEELRLTVEKAFNEQECLQKIIDFLQNEAQQGKLNNKGIKTMVMGYFYDTAMHIAQITNKIKPGGYYVMVNDNVRYNGLSIPVDLILSEIAERFGLTTEKIWVLPTGKGNSSQQMKKHGRSELRKCVYVWKKRIPLKR